MPDVKDATLHFRARDGITPTLKRMGKEATKFGNKLTRALDRSSKRGKRFATQFGAMLTSQIVYGGLRQVQRGIMEVGEAYVGLDDAITRAGAKFPEKIQRGTKAFNDLKQAATDVGITTEFTMVDSAKGLDFLAKAGFSAAQGMAALPGLADLATVADTDLARSSDIATDALTAFGLATKDPIKLTKNLTRVADVFAKTANTANTDIILMYETLQYGGPVVKGAGQQIETFAAITGKMASGSIKGTKAGTAIKNMFIRLQAQTPKTSKALKKLGVDVVDKKTGNLRDMVDILSDLDKAMVGMGGVKKTKFLDAIFGKRAIVGVNVLFEQGIENLREYRGELRAAGGTVKKTAEQIRGSLLNRLKQLKSAMLGKGIDLINAMMGRNPQAAGKHLKGFIDKVRKFDVKPLAKTMKSLLDTMMKLAKFIYRNRDLLIGFGKAYIGLKVAFAAFNIARAVTDWGRLGANIAVAMSKAKGMGRLTSAMDIAGGGRVGATGAGFGGLMKTNVSRMSITGAIGSVAIAGAAGVAIGTALYEGWIAPSTEKHYKKMEKRDEAVFQSKMDIFHGPGAESVSDPKKLLNQMANVNKLLQEVTTEKIEYAYKQGGEKGGGVGTMITDFMGFAEDLFTKKYWTEITDASDIIGEVNRPYEKMLVQRKNLIGQHEELEKRYVRATDIARYDAEQTRFADPWEREQAEYDRSQTTQYDEKKASKVMAEEQRNDRLAKAIGDVIKDRPLEINVNIDGAKADASVTIDTKGAPKIKEKDLGGAET